MCSHLRGTVTLTLESVHAFVGRPDGRGRYRLTFGLGPSLGKPTVTRLDR